MRFKKAETWDTNSPKLRCNEMEPCLKTDTLNDFVGHCDSCGEMALVVSHVTKGVVLTVLLGGSGGGREGGDGGLWSQYPSTAPRRRAALLWIYSKCLLAFSSIQHSQRSQREPEPNGGV